MSPYRMKNDMSNVYELMVHAEMDASNIRSHLSKDKQKTTNDSALKHNISSFQKIYNQN